MTDLLGLVARLRQSEPEPVVMQQNQVQRVIDCGLGPIFWHLLDQQQIKVPAECFQALQSSDLTARVLAAQSARNVREICALLTDLDIDCLLLKGADAASRFYPKAHWRIMRDIDLLVRPHDIGRARQGLLDAGFANPTDRPESDWDDHHHIVPLYHDQRKIWVEIHQALFPPYSPFADEAIFQPDTCWKNWQRNTEGQGVLPAETCVLYTICHWYGSLCEDFGEPGQQRALVDAGFLLAAEGLDLADIASLKSETLQRALTYFINVGSQAALFTLQRPAKYATPPVGNWWLTQISNRYLLPCQAPQRNITRQVAGQILAAALTCRNQPGFTFRVLNGVLRTLFAGGLARLSPSRR